MIHKAFFKKPKDRTEQEIKEIREQYSCLGCKRKIDCLKCSVFANQFELERFQELANEKG